MKFLLVTATAIAVFTVDCQDFANKPPDHSTDSDSKVQLLSGGIEERDNVQNITERPEVSKYTESRVSGYDNHQKIEEKMVKNQRQLRKSKCKVKQICVFIGGFCVNNSTLCGGRLVPEGCKGNNCQCCVPDILGAKMDQMNKDLNNTYSKMFSMLEPLNKIKETLAANIDQMNKSINNSFSNISSMLEPLQKNKDTLVAKIDQMNKSINNSYSNITSMLEPLHKNKDTLLVKIDQMNKAINNTFSNISLVLEPLHKNKDTLGAKMDQMTEALNNVFLNISTMLEPFLKNYTVTTPGLTTTKAPTTILPVKSQYWVGAYDQASPGTYKWFNGTTVNSNYWFGSYHLGNGRNRGQSCVKLHGGNKLIAASDTNCNTASSYKYICEEQ